ncbi:MAG: hypothetical protein A4S09_00615 [Proteobacteria bacterium SG_bin7]|nr:MAG: hypothetical protein A4S09_00615 [Proteobacteria bacterium SG_bin7]
MNRVLNIFVVSVISLVISTGNTASNNGVPTKVYKTPEGTLSIEPERSDRKDDRLESLGSPLGSGGKFPLPVHLPTPYPAVRELAIPSGDRSLKTRLVAMGDTHGDFDTMVKLLSSPRVGIINKNLEWVGGNTQFVVNGDLLDRGAGSRKIMDLLMALEEQAPKAGGAVHVLIGNHELMNLLGDLSYVGKDEMHQYHVNRTEWQQSLDNIEGFYTRSEKPKGMAEYYNQKFIDHVRSTSAFNSFLYGLLGGITIGKIDENGLSQIKDEIKKLALESMEKKYTPAFVGHRHAFSSQGKYGKWIRKHSALVKVGNSIFMHGGISERFSNLSYEQLKSLCDEDFAEFFNLVDELVASNSYNIHFDGRDLRGFIEENRYNSKLDKKFADIITRLDTLLTTSPFFANDGVLWDRTLATGGNSTGDWEGVFGGIFSSGDPTKERLEKILHLNNVERIVLGHTVTPSRRIESKYDNQLWLIDVGMNKTYAHGLPQVLEITPTSTRTITTSEEIYHKKQPQTLPLPQQEPQFNQ